MLPSNVRTCDFCDASLAEASYPHRDSAAATRGSLALQPEESAWRGELAERVEAYRTRRRKSSAGRDQPELPFEKPPARSERTVAVEEPAEESFSFTIAIGRPGKKREVDDPRMVIDVSMPPAGDAVALPRHAAPESAPQETGLFPVAPMDRRRTAAIIDLLCLAFSYGGFLTLFGSMGGQFTLSKLSAAVCAITFAIVYLQYFTLFTVFGGTTPGMMLRGLQVVSFSGEPPTPRQTLWRSVGYVLSAGTFFLGFLWALWDEDSLTWHDRISHTYLGFAEPKTGAEGLHPHPNT